MINLEYCGFVLFELNWNKQETEIKSSSRHRSGGESVLVAAKFCL